MIKLGFLFFQGKDEESEEELNTYRLLIISGQFPLVAPLREAAVRRLSRRPIIQSEQCH